MGNSQHVHLNYSWNMKAILQQAIVRMVDCALISH